MKTASREFSGATGAVKLFYPALRHGTHEDCLPMREEARMRGIRATGRPFSSIPHQYRGILRRIDSFGSYFAYWNGISRALF
jgi:hypothetical protein